MATSVTLSAALDGKFAKKLGLPSRDYAPGEQVIVDDADARSLKAAGYVALASPASAVPMLGGPNTWVGTQDFTGANVTGLAAGSGGNPVPPNAPSPITGWFHATAYGAKFNGTNDDRPAILAAVAACQAAGGGKVYLNPGTAMLSGGGSASAGCVLISGNNVEIAGAGKGVTILKLMNGQDTTYDVTGLVRTASGVQQTGVTVRDMTLDGNKAGNSTPGRRVMGFYCGVTPASTQTDTQIKCINVEVKNCSDYGFDPHERTTGLVLDHCESHDNTGDGFTLDGQYDAVLIGCLAWNNGRHGFNFVTASADCTMDGCHAWGNASNGVTLQQGAKRITINGGTFHGNTGDGISINGVPLGVGQIDQTPGGANKVTGVSVFNNGAHGIHLVGTSYCHIVGNTVLDNSQAGTGTSNGIYLDESAPYYSTFNRIMNNTVRSSGAPTHKYSIYEKTTSNDSNFIHGNVLAGATTKDLQLAGPTSIALAAHNGVNEHPAVAPYSSDSPGNHGLKDWNYDIGNQGASAGTTATGGTIFLMRVDAQSAGPITNVHAIVGAAGAGLANCYAAVIDVASGNVLGTTADQSTAWQSTGFKTMALTAPTAAVAVGQKLWIALLANGTTPPGLVRSGATSASQVNAGQSTSSPLRFSTYQTAGQTAIPANIPYASTTGTGALTFWVGTS